MSLHKIALDNAIGFFVFWLLILLAGADKPPPPNFIWLVVAVAFCAAAVFWRIPTYIAWYCSRRAGRLWRVALDGVIAGILAALPFALRGGGEPTSVAQPGDYAVWFLVVGIVGVGNAMTLHGVNALVARRTTK